MDTNLCVIRLSEGERIGDVLGKVLDTADMTTIGAFAVSKDNPTELHYHDFDEYWYFYRRHDDSDAANGGRTV